MVSSRMRGLLQDICSTVLEQDEAGLSDGELLTRFLRDRDGSAFAPLVRRHGPMVWGVCRRILHQVPDAEDAFQATFLVLLRKAASIHPRDMVANWLHGVALRTAWKARTLAGRRKQRERALTEMSEPAAIEPTMWRELQPLLDQELSRLPDKYRGVIILCDLEGRTRKEAAQQLRVPEGTVAGRLARARAMLARRLARHGVELSAVAVAALLAQDGTQACVPAPLLASTIQASALLAAGPSATGAFPTPVISLADQVLKVMLLTKLKIATALMLGVTAAGLGLMALAPAQTRSTTAGSTPEQPETKDGTAIRRLIDQFASPKFAEREAAARELRRIGEPALGPLRETARGHADLEVRRRAEAVAQDIRDDAIARLLKEESREDRAHDQKVARILERVTELGREQVHKDRRATAAEQVPVLADAFLRLARTRNRLGESAAAADAYQQAEHFCQDPSQRRVLRAEMAPVLMPIWEKAVRDRMGREPDLKRLAAKYPLVVLHSRRYAPLDGNYGRCSYSFIYETANEREHGNDVQIQFDNHSDGPGESAFLVNMVTNQRNSAVDLGNVDFATDPDSAKADRPEAHHDQHPAIPGHVYLERVQDTNGNRFFVLFKIVAVDKESRYMAFLWRRLPGGKIVRRR